MKYYSQPAFPVLGAAQDNQFNGMSLRDYFAAKAMQTLINETQTLDIVRAVAMSAYDIADAMLEARENGQS